MPGHSFSLRSTLVLLTVLSGATVHPSPVCGQGSTGKSSALLVGVRDYQASQFAPLKYTENDVEELGKLLSERAGFAEVRLLTTARGKSRQADAPTIANIRTAIKRLLAGKTRHDTILVALAGHGLQQKVQAGKIQREESFFCPADAQINDVKTLVSLRTLFQDFKACGAAVKLVLVDACRNDPQESRSINLDAMPRPAQGVAALFSCKGGERAFETNKLGKGHGVFFHYVLEGLKGEAKNRKGEVTWSGLADYVTEKVSDGVPALIGGGAKQTPQEIKNLTGKAPVLVHDAPERRFIGRWALTFDGWEGVLDISRTPKEGEPDRRIGVFYDKNDPKKAYQVNGGMKDNRIDFYIDWTNANPARDLLAGRHFVYYLGEGDPNLMAGSHRDPDGRVWGGFGRRLTSAEAFPGAGRAIPRAGLPEVKALAPAARLPSVVSPDSYLGVWKLHSGKTAATIVLTRRDDSVVPAGKKAEYAGLRGDNAIALVHRRNPAQIELTASLSAGAPAHRFIGRLLSWEHGVAAGTATVVGGAKGTFGAVLVRERSNPR